MRDLIKVLSYEGNNVTFKNENGITYANATEMAKAFDKTPYEWLRLPSTQKLINALVASGKSLSSLVITENGNSTHLHEDLALDFAQWLSIDFRIWCNARIKELLTIGMTATPSALEEMILSPDMVIGLATKLKEERQRVSILEQTNSNLESTVKIQAPKAEYFDKVLQSESLLTTTEIGALLGLSAIAMNKKLKESGIQWKVNGRWVLTAKYNHYGYTKDKTVPLEYDAHGEVIRTSTSMYWTEKGKHFILSFFNEAKTA